MRRAEPALVVCFAGASAALLGLAWDVSIHTANPALAAHESPFDVISPAHDLLVLGIVLAAASAAWLVSVRVSRVVGMVAVAIILLSVGWMAFSLYNAPAPPRGTQQQEEAASRLWHETDLATRRYASLSTAVADGYIAFNPIADPLVHYVKPAYLHDGSILDPEHVESLLYESTIRGPVLVAAMYSLEDPQATPPDVAGDLTPWHRHDDLCFTPAGEVVGAAPGCPTGSATYYTPWMLHVWLVPDRYGRFAADLDPWNELMVELFG
jgi:hypothetical protein